MRPKRTAKPRLGRLEKISPGDYWQEASDFLSWLQEPDNLELLNEALGLELTAATDDAGIRWSEALSQSPVLLAVQLGETDAAGLGQLIEQAATQSSPLILIWVAATFTPQHQRVLSWLNSLEAELYGFGVEVELWRIGKDAMAVNFTVVGQPLDWEEAEVEEAEPEPEPEPEPLSPTQQENLDFWTQLCAALDRRGSIVKPGAPTVEAAMGFAIARAGFRLRACIEREQQALDIQLQLSGDDAHPHFYLLALEQDRITDDIGVPLRWDDSQEQRATVAGRLEGVDICDRSRWPDYLAWLCPMLERFYETFSPRIKHLDAADYQSLPDYGVRPANPMILPG